MRKRTAMLASVVGIRIILYLCIFLSGLTTILNILFRVRLSPGGGGLKLLVNSPIIWGIAVFLICLILLWEKATANVPEKYSLILFTGLYLAMGLFLILSVNENLYGDPKMIHRYIPAFMQGDFSGFEDGRYFSWFPFLLGTAAYEMLIARISDSVRFLFFLNLVYVILINHLLYCIFKKLWPDSTRQQLHLVILFLFSFAPAFFHILYVYGTTPGFFLTVLSTVFFAIDFRGSDSIVKTRWGRNVARVACAATLSVACIIKQNFMIMGIAMAIILVLEAMQSRKMYRVVFAVFLISTMIISKSLFMSCGRQWTRVDYGEGVPITLYFAMGLQERDSNPLYNGWYNGYNFEVYGDSGFDEELASAVGREFIVNRLQEFAKNPVNAFTFFYYKILSTWCEPTYQSIELGPIVREVGDSNNAIVQSLYEGDWSFIVYEHYVSAMQIVIFLFLTMGLVFGRKEIIEHVVLLLPCLFLIGGYLYHLISETRGVYVYYYVWMLMPIAATGFYRTENCVKALFASGPVFVTDTNEDPETSEPRK